MDVRHVKGHLELLVLAAVRRKPAHGYGIIRTLRERSGGVFDLPEGSVYPLLHRLEQRGLLGSAWADEGARKRRVYRLTAAGARALARNRREWKDFARALEAVVEARG